MLRDITLGQYYPADSVVHKLDPRVKLFATMIYIIALFTFQGILGFAIITGMLIFMIKISKVPFSYIVKGLKAIVVLLLITAVFNLVFTPTGTEYWHWGPFHLTSTGIMNAVLMTIRLIYLIIGTDKIMKAQMARGADFEDGNLIQKAKSMVPLLIPLFVSAFRRADDLAMAMEARCYSGGEGRTKMKPLRYQGTDRKAYVILIAFLVLVIVARVLLRWPQ